MNVKINQLLPIASWSEVGARQKPVRGGFLHEAHRRLKRPDNRIARPLNHYGLNYAVVTCPLDQGRTQSQPNKNSEWVGNSYLFNCYGLTPGTTGGLDGQRATAVTRPARTVLFADCILALPTEPCGWHAIKPAGNVAAGALVLVVVLVIDSAASFDYEEDDEDDRRPVLFKQSFIASPTASAEVILQPT